MQELLRGSAALIYGCLIGAENILIGSPQYRIGDYLTLNEYHKRILNEIIDEKHDINWLNSLIDRVIDECNKNILCTRISIVYSDKEEDWLDIKALLNKLGQESRSLKCYNEGFSIHSEIGTIFPKYLKVYAEENKEK